MLIDEQLRFSNAQAITNAAASQNLIDLKAISNYGDGARPLYVVAQVTTAFTDTGSNSTLTVLVQTDDNADFNSATNSQTVGSFAALSAVGSQLIVQLAPAAASERYLRLYYDPPSATGDLSAGAVTAFLTADPQRWTAFAKGYTGPTTA